MIRISASSEFQRAYKRLRRNPDLLLRVDRALKQLAADPYHASLKTHVLQGKLAGAWACSAAYDLRILFKFKAHPETKAREILLIDLGSHDEVY